MSTSSARPRIAAARRVVVKIGSAALTGGSDALDRAYMHDLAAQFNALIAAGREVIIVSSGAVAAGLKEAGLDKRPADVAGQQAAAAAGQPLLMARWHEAFAVRARPVAQVLLSRADFDTRERFLNLRNCISRLLELGVVPIINENDTVATEEISLGDNDVLAAKLATAVLADVLVILSTAGGVMDSSGVIVPDAPDAESLKSFIRTEMSGQGRGGMATKLEAARIASKIGVPTIIAPGRPPDIVGRVLSGEPLGTCIAGGVQSDAERRAGRRSWIALTATPAGTIDVDEGAAKALTDRGASLLAKGVKASAGRFEVGDVVAVRHPSGAEIARGLTNLSSDELRVVMGRESRELESLLGRQTHAEVIHRDNLVVTVR